MKFLENKRVLFIAYSRFNYYKHIQKAIIKAGAKVDHFSTVNKNISYILAKELSSSYLNRLSERHGHNILSKTKSIGYDYIFVIHGFQLLPSFYEELHRRYPNAIFINYTWDSIRSTPFNRTQLDVLKYFNKSYSFDRRDCDRYKQQEYLPLFYIDDFISGFRSNSEVKEYDLVFVGTLSKKNRYNAIKSIEDYCSKNDLRFYYFLKVAVPFFLKCLFNGTILRNVSFLSISHRKLVELYSKSNAIIDLPQQHQSGLTMRTIETLAAGNKLITTNVNIKKEMFYSPRVIKIIDLNNVGIDEMFLKEDISSNNNLDMSEYSIHNWIKTIFRYA